MELRDGCLGERVTERKPEAAGLRLASGLELGGTIQASGTSNRRG